MSALRIELNHDAVREILQSREVLDRLEEIGNRIADAAGPGHEVQTFVGKNRARVTVRTSTPDAMASEATGRTLTQAIEAGRE